MTDTATPTGTPAAPSAEMPTTHPRPADLHLILSQAALVLAAFALMTCGFLWFRVTDLQHRPTGRVLIYDDVAIPLQVKPFVDAGQDANAVVRSAFQAALAQGYVIIRRSDSVTGPEQAEFRISAFLPVPPPPETPVEMYVPEELDSWLQSQTSTGTAPAAD